MTDQEWEELITALREHDQRSLAAAADLQRRSTHDDIPRLVELLDDDSFFVREAAAWPLSDLGATDALPKLLEALERGVNEGMDNDGLNAALADLASAHGKAARRELERIISAGGPLTRHAEWLIDFCKDAPHETK